MYGDEYVKIKNAVENYAAAGASKEHLQHLRQRLNERRKESVRLRIGFVGWADEVQVPETINEKLYQFLDEQLSAAQSELTAFQLLITCPAATSDR